MAGVAKPTETLGWATNTVQEPVIINGSPVFVTNKVEPTQELKDSGVRAREPWARAYLNWLFNFFTRWIQNLDSRTSLLGRVEVTTDAARTVAMYATEFGGTWTALGSSTVGTSTTAYFFERTA